MAAAHAAAELELNASGSATQDLVLVAGRAVDIKVAADSSGGAGSGAIDAASADFPPTDMDGVPRPQDGDGDRRARADLGAHEWGEIDADGDGWFADGGDCDDTDPLINPAAQEVAYDGVDQDCTGSDLLDVDGDGWGHRPR